MGVGGVAISAQAGLSTWPMGEADGERKKPAERRVANSEEPEEDLPDWCNGTCCCAVIALLIALLTGLAYSLPPPDAFDATKVHPKP